jgi:hypothetical protein
MGGGDIYATGGAARIKLQNKLLKLNSIERIKSKKYRRYYFPAGQRDHKM